MPRPGYEAVLLVTGFPSLYARTMVAHILAAEPRSLVYAVVPADRAARAEAERARMAPADARPEVCYRQAGCLRPECYHVALVASSEVVKRLAVAGHAE